tara:strand:- start:7408 stop:8115 length:708 start_codon:yes stop_codon:yes gene_type:complete
MNFNSLKILFLVLIFTGLSAFSIVKNGNRNVNLKNVNLIETNLKFTSEELVNKLLKQSASNNSSLQKRNLNLNLLENLIEKDSFIKSAEIFLYIDCKIGIKIVEKNPVFRVLKDNYYIDSSGNTMPVSSIFSKETPLIISNVIKRDLNNLGTIGNFLENDVFLNEHISGLEIYNDSLIFHVKGHDYKINMKGFKNYKERFTNYKAFYKSTYNDSILSFIKSINLNFHNQVVVQKK